MKSLMTIIREADFDKLNENQFGEIIRKLNPELYLIYLALLETQVSPLVISHVIRGVGNLNLGTGTGVVRVYVLKKKVKNVQVEENTFLNEDAYIDNEEK